jgi:antitoxin component YwqK of YwqJK toxin-antitoxin module
MHMRISLITVVTAVSLCAGCSSVRFGKEEKKQGPPPGFNGTWTTYYANGRKKSEVSYRGGKAHGRAVVWYENGREKSECHNVFGVSEGKYIRWHENGKKKEEGFLKRDPKAPESSCYHGTVTKWAEDGRIQSMNYYNNGKRIGRR